MISIFSVLLILMYIYIFVIILLMLLDNRDAQSTLAWIFIFLLFPVLGVIVYIFIGRNWRRVSKKKRFMNQFISRSLTQNIQHLIRKQKKEMQKIDDSALKKKTLNLLKRNSQSLLVTCNRLEILQNGAEKFPRLFRDIMHAKCFIHMEYYIWKDDPLTREIKDLLKEKAKEGVEVRIVYDALGSFWLPEKYKKELRKEGIQIYPYFNFLAPLRWHTLNYRNHRKLVVIDGDIGYTGGMNLSDEYIHGGKRFRMIRDTHMRLTGQATTALQSVFATSWYNTTKENLFSEKYFPKIRQKRGIPVQLTTSGPDSEWDSIKQLFMAMITNAQDKVYIQTPYFVPGKSVYESLKTAALSGVDVRVMMTGVPDKKIPFWSAFTYFEELLKAGVRIYQYNKGFLHSKTINVDSQLCSIGSANLDIRSFKLDYELNTLIYDSRKAKELENDFMEDLKHCKEITYKDYRKIPIHKKLRNSLARLFSPLL